MISTLFSRGLWLSTSLVIVLVGVRSCSLDLDVHTASFERGKGAYSIDPQTILQSLDRGATDVFLPQSTQAQSEQADRPLVQWTQADYWQIVQAMHELVLHDSMDGWNLYDFFFRLDCTDTTSGPQLAGLEFFRVVKIRERDSRLERFITVLPRQDSVQWWESEYYPERAHWKPIEITQIQVPVEEALRIADDNGGGLTRIGMNDQCVIHASLHQGDSEWQISYYTIKGSKVFDIYVDSRTGTFRMGSLK